MNPRIVALGTMALVAVVALAVIAPWRSSEAHGPDVNGDGQVDLFNDIFTVAAAFGQTVPTPQILTSYVVTVSPPDSSKTRAPTTSGWVTIALRASAIWVTSRFHRGIDNAALWLATNSSSPECRSRSAVR